MGRCRNRRPRWREQGYATWWLLVTVLWVGTLASPSQAANFEVDRTDDPDPATAMACTGAPNDCSLRGAIELANGDATPDMITFAQNGIYTLDPGRGQLTINTDVTIAGTGADCSGAGTCIEADMSSPSPSGFRVFSITTGNVEISALTIRHGFGTPGGGLEIQENATVSMSNCHVDENLAGRGGGIFNSGNLTLIDCVLEDNRALIGGALFNNGTTGISGDSQVIVNGALFGGGIANVGKITVGELGTAPGAGVMPGVTLQGTEVGGNRALVGGGIWNDAGTGLLLLQFFGLGLGTGSSAVEVGDANLLVTEESSVVENAAVIGGGIANTRFPITQIDLGGSEPIPVSVGSALTTVDYSEVVVNGALLAGGIANDDIATQLLLILANELLGSLSVQPGVSAAGALDPTSVDQVLAVLGTGAPQQFVQQTFEQQDLGPVIDALQQASPMFDLSMLSDAAPSDTAEGVIDQHASLTLMNADVEGNAALIGGGVVNTDHAAVDGAPLNLAQEPGTFEGSSISNNNFLLATDGNLPEPELGLIEGGLGFLCGGVLNVSSMTIQNTLVVENTAFAGGGICNWGVIPEGGFFQLFGADQPEGQRPFSNADLTVTASAVAANAAFAFGGIWNDSNTILYAVINVVLDVLEGFAQAPGIDEPALGIAPPALPEALLQIQGDTIVVGNGAFLTGGLANTRFPFEALPFSPLLGGTAATTITDSAIANNEADSFGGVQNDSGLLPLIATFILDEVFGSPFPPLDLSLTDVTATRLEVSGGAIDENQAGAICGLGNIFATALLEQSSVNGNELAPGGESFSGNFAGGVYHTFGTTVLNECTVDDNGADETDSTFVDFGGGVLNDGFAVALDDFILFTEGVPQPVVELGYSLPTEDSTLEIISTTISNNGAAMAGGGLFNVGQRAVTTATNSTFSGNSCRADGGAIANEDFGTVDLSNATITDNTAGVGGIGSGGGIFEASANLTIKVKNTVIAGNFDAGGDGNAFPDCWLLTGTITSFGYNLIGDESGCAGIFNQTGDQAGTSGSPIDPHLGPLADNGGPTFTHALCSGVGLPDASCTDVSPALDGVGLDACTDLDGADVTTDQRGFARPQGMSCDIGAYETTCGDGLLDGGEQCDTGDLEPTCCSDQCQLLGAETVCRPATDVCDAAETCAGQVDGLCPPDEVLPAGTECRPPANVCDPTEDCDGSSKACPADVPYLDTDGDGVCDGQEVPGDEDDPSVTSFIPEGEDEFKVRLELLANCGQILNFKLSMEEELPVDDPDFFYPCGLIGFELPCATADVKATFNGINDLEAGGFVYRKFNPNTLQYFDMPVPVQLMGNMAFFTLTDGGPADTDGTANGRIVDPNGPGLGGGTAPAPVMSPLGFGLALLLLLGVSAVALRRRSRR